MAEVPSQSHNIQQFTEGLSTTFLGHALCWERMAYDATRKRELALRDEVQSLKEELKTVRELNRKLQEKQK